MHSELILDDQHRYWYRGQRVPGVTEVLKATGICDDKWFTPWARDRGNAVHRGAELYLAGTLDWATVDPRIKGYLEGLVQFCTDAKVVGAECEIERKVFNPIGRYGGRADLIGCVFGKRTVVDWKSGGLGHAGVQLAAYEAARFQEDFSCTGQWPAARARIAVQLMDTGRYKMTTYTQFDDYTIFQAALTLYNAYHRTRKDKDNGHQSERGTEG